MKLFPNVAFRSAILVVLLAMASVSLTGCPGSVPTGTVAGKVTYKGAPLTAGVVNFYNAEKGSAATADLDSSGAFKIGAPLPVGTYKVYVLPPTPKQLPPGEAQPKVDFPLPPKLQDAGQTPVTEEVKAGANDFTIDLPE